MTGDQRPLPAEAVEHRDDVVDRLDDRERTLEGGWLKTSLLKGPDMKLGLELDTEPIEIRIAQAGAAVEQQHVGPGTRGPTAQRAAVGLNLELLPRAHRLNPVG